jgi:O-antigen biosynthesis protein
MKKMGHNMEFVVKGQYEYPDVDDTDIIVYSRYYNSDPFRSIWKHKIDGKKIVYDMDDDVWNIPPLSPAHHTYKEAHKNITGLCKEADLVTVSTEYLANVVEENTGVKPVVIPNALNLDKFKERPHGDRLKIGWTGGSNHYEDINIILDVIKDLQKEYDFDFIIQGLSASPWEVDAYNTDLKLRKDVVPEEMINFDKEKMKVYDKFRNMDLAHVVWYPPEMYPALLRTLDLDIGLIPVKGYLFDKSKSILKYLEYTAVGTAAIASDTEPYKCVKYRAKNKYKDWKNKIEKLIKDKELREKLVEEQKKQLFPKYDIKEVAKVYEKELLNLLK